MSFIPTVIERSANVERVYDLYSCLLKERIILCVGEVNDEMAASITAQLLYLSSLNNDDILMYINSPGGSISSGLAIYDVMNHIHGRIGPLGQSSGALSSVAVPHNVGFAAGSRRISYKAGRVLPPSAPF